MDQCGEPGRLAVTPPDVERPQLALVLAGGRGRRMGGVDKALLALSATDTLLSALLGRLSGQCGRIAISANGDLARFAATGLAVLPDTVADAGPLAGVLAGLDHLGGTDGWMLTVPGDTPLIPHDLARRLAVEASTGRVRCVRATSGSRRHPLVALWSTALREPLRTALLENGVRRVEAFQEAHGAGEVAWPASPDDPFANVNTRDDLEAVRRIAAAQRSALADREHLDLA